LADSRAGYLIDLEHEVGDLVSGRGLAVLVDVDDGTSERLTPLPAPSAGGGVVEGAHGIGDQFAEPGDVGVVVEKCIRRDQVLDGSLT
jgi:hypothetical protein